MPIAKQQFKFRGSVALAVYDNTRFDSTIASLCENRDSFRIIHRPFSTELIFSKPESTVRFGKNVNYGGFCKVNQSSDKEFGYDNIRCIAEMNADVYRHIYPLIRDGRLNKIKPSKDWPIQFIFKDNWDRIAIGDPLWYIDLDNYYPCIAVKLGYLTETVMNKFIFDEFKRSRNIALSKLMSVVKVDYYIDGKLSHTIKTDRSLVEYAYQNVIEYGRNFINHICDKYRWTIIGRDIDNIIFPVESKTIIIGKYINIHGFDYKRYLSYKISDNQIRIAFDGRIKSYNFLC
ncbi:MAG: hypothetical protein PHT07_21460 [Paludibacter sp.]|nr:hypothetical protein [Paludibacter sp.]